jgi:hypothetical protein
MHTRHNKADRVHQVESMLVELPQRVLLDLARVENAIFRPATKILRELARTAHPD